MGAFLYISLTMALVLGVGITVLMYLVKALEGIGAPQPIPLIIQVLGGLGLIIYFFHKMFVHFLG